MEQELEIDLRELYIIIKRKLGFIFGIAIIFAFISAGVSYYLLTPMYESESSIIIGKAANANIDEDKQTYTDVIMYQKLMTTYSEVAKSLSIAERTVKKLDFAIKPENLLKTLTISSGSDTQIMKIKARYDDPKKAAQIVNAHVESFIANANELIPSGYVQIMDVADVNESPVSPRKTLNVAIAAMLGVMISLGIVFLEEHLNNTIKSEQDIQKYLNLPIIGIIPKSVR